MHSILLQSKGVNVILWSFNWISRIITLYRGNCCNLLRKIPSIVATVLIALFFLCHYIILRIALDERTFWWKNRENYFSSIVYSPNLHTVSIVADIVCFFGINFIVPQLFFHNYFSMSIVLKIHKILFFLFQQRTIYLIYKILTSKASKSFDIFNILSFEIFVQ